MTSTIPIRLMAALVVGLLICFAVLPDYLFFPIAGLGTFVAGAFLTGDHPAWGWGLMVVGVGLGALGVKSGIDHTRRERVDADKAENEVRRRFGKIREDE